MPNKKRRRRSSAGGDTKSGTPTSTRKRKLARNPLTPRLLRRKSLQTTPKGLQQPQQAHQMWPSHSPFSVDSSFEDKTSTSININSTLIDLGALSPSQLSTPICRRVTRQMSNSAENKGGSGLNCSAAAAAAAATTSPKKQEATSSTSKKQRSCKRKKRSSKNNATIEDGEIFDDTFNDGEVQIIEQVISSPEIVIIHDSIAGGPKPRSPKKTPKWKKLYKNAKSKISSRRTFKLLKSSPDEGKNKKHGERREPRRGAVASSSTSDSFHPNRRAVPTFNPNAAPDTNFTSGLGIVPGGVFHFNGGRDRVVPTMGTRQLSTRTMHGMSNVYTVSYTHLTLPTIYSV